MICDKRDDLGCKNTHAGKQKQKAFVISHFINFLVDFCITFNVLGSLRRDLNKIYKSVVITIG